MQMMAQFAEFKKTMQGKNPEAIVKQMLANGQMSQTQFEQLKQQASLMLLSLCTLRQQGILLFRVMSTARLMA